jgi:TolB-like protein
VLTALACAGPRGAPDAGTASGAERAPYRLALLPAENMAAAPVPLRGVDDEIARALAAAGLEVVSGDAVEQFLQRHRLRYTGGIDEESAAAAHEELGVDGVLLASIELYEMEPVPRVALLMRVVSAIDASIVWMDGTARAGNDAPGLLGLGLVSRQRELMDRELRRLAGSLVATLRGPGPRSQPCPDERRFRPRIVYRSPGFDPAQGYSVAVLPFVNETGRRRAGDLVALEVARQLAAIPRLKVLEPGVVRKRLIGNRVVMEGGVSVDAARLVLDHLHADLVVAGYVREFNDGAEPSVNFTVMALERERGRIMWESTSHATGSDGVWFFGLGAINTAGGLTCRMSRDVVTAFLGG